MKKLLFSMALAVCATFSVASESKANTVDHSLATNVQATAPETAQAMAELPKIKYIMLNDGTLLIYGMVNGKWYLIAIV